MFRIEMVMTIYKTFSKNLSITNKFLFMSFIYLSAIKYNYFQFRFLVLILLVPCGLKIISECVNRKFRNTIIFLFFININ